MVAIGPKVRPHKENTYIKTVVERVARAIDPKAFEDIPKGPQDAPSAFQKARDKKVEELKLLKEEAKTEARVIARRAIIAYLGITAKLRRERLVIPEELRSEF